MDINSPMFAPTVQQMKDALLPDLQAMVPQASTSTPPSESVSGTPGTNIARFAQEGHQHPRLTSTTYATLDNSGQALVTFTRSFVNKPGLNLTETDATAGGQPLVMRAISWQRDANGLYTGVTIEGQRARMLPTLSALSGTLTLLTQVVTGVNNLVTALTNFNIFAGPAVGAVVSVIAVARSDVSAS